MSYELASNELPQASSSSVLSHKTPGISERIRVGWDGMVDGTPSFNAEGAAEASTSGRTGPGNTGGGHGDIRASTNVARRPRANRRLSLKSLRLIPQKLSTSVSTESSHETTSSIMRRFATDASAMLPLPPDVILDIASRLSSSTLLNLILTSSAHHDLLLPSLYRTLTLSSSSHCLSILPFLLKRPERCSYVHEIALKPNYYLAWPRKDKSVDETWVAVTIAEIASKGSLKNLEWFEWEGMEMPKDGMWEALRVNCPKLKNISTHVGKKTINPYSTLFDFSDLTSFSLIARHNIEHVANDVIDVFPNASLPDKFWKMILNRCPNLTDLTICSFSPYTCSFNIAPLLLSIHSSSATSATDTTTRFPKLKSLTLGSFRYQSDFAIPQDPTSQLGEFLSHHPSITYLRALWNFKRWMSPEDISLFFPSFLPEPTSRDSLGSSLLDLKSPRLPELETFVGIYQQLSGLPLDSRKKIKVVDITCEPVYEVRVDKVCEVLRTVETLKVLDVWVHVPTKGEQNDTFFGKLVNACMGLEELHFMCTTPFGKKSIDQLLTHLSRLPSLHRFSLTKGHTYQGDESMLATAIRIFKVCRGLKTVSVRLAREKCLNHLKQEGIYDVVHRSTRSHGDEVTLLANERGIPLVGRPFERSYRRRVLI